MRLIDADETIQNLKVMLSYCGGIADANVTNENPLDAITEIYKAEGIKVAIREIDDNAIEVPESLYEQVYGHHLNKAANYSGRCRFCNESAHCLALDGILDKCTYVRPLPQDREMWAMAKVMCRCYEEDK